MDQPQSRRTAWIAGGALVLAVLALLWWRSGRERDDGSTAATSTDGTKLGGRTPIGASAEDGEPVPRRWDDRSASIAGTVRTKDGTPIAAADVCVLFGVDEPEVPSALRRAPRCATTGTDGRYAMAELPPLQLGVHASAPTFVPGQHERSPGHDGVRLQAGQHRTDIDIVLAPGGVEIRGVVEDVSGGVIEGALVHHAAWSLGPGRGMGFTKSDERGEFSLWVGPGDVSLAADAEGYAPGFAHGPAPGHTFSIPMTPESVLAGIVVHAADGTPVADARVDASQDGSATVYTDARGRFRIDRLEPGRYKPSASTEGGYGLAAQSVHLGLGQSAEEVRIELHPAVSVRGRVVLAGTGTPCTEGSVSLADNASHLHHEGSTRDDGSVQITAVQPGTYEVGVHCEGKLAAQSYPKLIVGTEPIVDLVWEVGDGLAVAGVVVGPDGAPVNDVWVSANPKTAAADGQVAYAQARTGVDGRFRLEGLVAGTYAVSAGSRGLDVIPPAQPTDVDVVAGPTPEIRIAMSAAGTVEGRVLDSGGKPVAKANIQLHADEHGWGEWGTSVDDGTFTIRGVRPQPYRVTASRGWRDTMRAPGTGDDDVQGERVTVRAGETARVELVVEDRSGRIRGRVVDESGGPVDDAFVQAHREPESAAAAASANRRRLRWGGGGDDPVLTDQDGRFELGNLAPGKHTIFATVRGGDEGMTEHVAVGSEGIVVRLTSGGSISGSVELAGGGAPKRFTLTLEAREIGFHRGETFFETEGAWTIDHLPPGEYQVSVEAPEGSDTASVTLADGESKAGIVLQLRPKVDVEGIIVDLDTGAPVSNVVVQISPRRSYYSFYLDSGGKENASDESGKFSVKAAPAGKVRIALMPRTGGDETYGFQMVGGTIPGDVRTYTLPPITLVKSRLLRDQPPGDLGFTITEPPLTVDVEDAPLTVAFIRPGGPAARTELAVGDVIVGVDGKDVRGENFFRYDTLVAVPQGTKLSLELQGGKTVEITAGKPP